jgi:hypothetical protein
VVFTGEMNTTDRFAGERQRVARTARTGSARP